MSETFEAPSDDIPKPSTDLVRRILAAGLDAGRVALEAAHKAIAQGSADYARRLTADEVIDVGELADRIIKAHVILARAEGAAAGSALSFAEATTLVGSAGTLTIPSAVLITATDLTGLVWIQVRMVLTLAALYGHDPLDAARLREFLSLQGATPAAAMPLFGETVGAGAGRMTTRLIKRYLKGPLLSSLRGLFATAGIKFSRAGLLRQVFLLNIPANMVVNDVATRRLGQKARTFYETLPK